MPVAVYVVEHNGRFVAGNKKLCELLQITADDLSSRNISEFYASSADRERLVADAVARRPLEKSPVRFVVNRREIQVQMFCRALGDAHFLGVLVEVTAETEFQHRFDEHSAGVYRVDARDKVTQASQRFAKIHGYDSVADVVNRNVRDFYADPADADRIRERIIATRSLEREPVQLKRRDGQKFTALLTAIPIFRGNQYDGRGGIVEELEERNYDEVFDDVPVGFYRIEIEKGHEVVVHCNREFARIHDFDSAIEIKGRDVKEFHASPAETDRLHKLLQDAATTGEAVVGEYLRITTKVGKAKTLEINARPHVRNGIIVGRTGAIRDISKEVEMRDHINSLRSDIGWLLHIFRQTLQQLKLSFVANAEIMSSNLSPDVTVLSPKALADEVREPVKALASSVDVLLAAVHSATHTAALTEKDLRDLKQRVDVMVACERRVNEFHQRDVWRRGAVEVVSICRRIKPGTVARGAIRPVIDAAQRITEITGLATAAVALEAIARVDSPVVSIREYVDTGNRPVEKPVTCTIEGCVTEAITNISGFAEQRGVEIRFEPRARTYVDVVRYTLTRGIENLLHNAVKYSWQRPEGNAWVNVAVTVTDKAMARVSIENWGVPVPAEEIEGGLVFRIGFRGRLSSDRGRPGTGVGLADSLAIARAYHGNLGIESRPAAGADRTNYDQPFVTTTHFEIPISRQKGDFGR